MATTITSVAGNGTQGYDGDGGPANQSLMDNPFHVELDRSERFFYIADCFNYCVRMVDLQTNIITTIAGTGEAGYSGDGGPATEARIEEIYAIQVAENGDVYILQRFSPAIRKVDASTGIISTVAGDGTVGYGGDGGPATHAQMREPNDCALDGKGGLLIADIQDQRIRRLDIETGIITTFAGTGEKTHSGDGGPASEAGIFGARAVCVDGRSNTYICEREGNSIRKVDSNGVITLVAGGDERGYTGDGGPAIEATLNGPKAIRCDADGNVLVVDTENHAIRKIDVSDGTISTVAGGRQGPEGDGGDSKPAG
ncbi:MAG: hypothetical protein IIB17_12720, partial [Chloroflexi bacterium]|nr:hypothetical protein [Chloroflexota bacterium]